VLQGSLARVPTKGQNTWLKLLTKAAIERTLKDAALLLENQRDGKPKTAVEMEKPATVKVTKGKGKAKAA